MKTLNTKELSRAISSIKTRSGNLSSSIHVAAVSCLEHMEQHGNMDLATNLHGAVSNAYKAHLKRWFAVFGPIGWDKKENKFRKNKGPNAAAFDIPGGIETSPDALAAIKNENTSEFEEVKALKAIRANLAKRVRANIEKSGEVFDDAMELSLTGIDAALANLTAK